MLSSGHSMPAALMNSQQPRLPAQDQARQLNRSAAGSTRTRQEEEREEGQRQRSRNSEGGKEMCWGNRGRVREEIGWVWSRYIASMCKIIKEQIKSILFKKIEVRRGSTLLLPSTEEGKDLKFNANLICMASSRHLRQSRLPKETLGRGRGGQERETV